jgi:hypothetical protein
MHPYDVETYAFLQHRELEAEADRRRCARMARGTRPAIWIRGTHGLGSLLVRTGLILQARAAKAFRPVREAATGLDWKIRA